MFRVNRPVIVNGAAAKDQLWNQIKSDLFGTPFYTMQSNEASCLGAAILAATGSGCFSSIKEAAINMTHIKSETKPNVEKRQYYLDMFQIYKEIYEELVPSFLKVSEVRRKI